MSRKNRVTVGAGLALLAAVGTHLFAEDPELAVGSAVVQGKHLAAYEATWSQKILQDGEWAEQGTITERAWLEQRDGRSILGRDAIFHSPQGLQIVTSIAMDRKTLAPLSWSRKMPDELPQAAKARMPKEASILFDGAAYRSRSTSFDGAVEEGAERKLSTPMFDASALGLVLATLPLKEGYAANLPAVYIMPQDLSVTEYRIGARVTGSDEFATATGQSVKAWRVEVDWIDIESGEISSKGGAEEAGGAYWVVPDPPKGFPYILKYANESVVIELIPG